MKEREICIVVMDSTVFLDCGIEQGYSTEFFDYGIELFKNFIKLSC